MLPSGCLFSDNAWVSSFKGLGLDEGVLVGRHELTLVVGAAVSNHDGRWILVGHHYCRLGQSATEWVRVVWLERLLKHACVQGVAHFVMMGREWLGLWWLLGAKINWFCCAVIKSEAYCLTIFRKDFAAGCNLSVLEHSCGVVHLWVVDRTFSCLSFCKLLGAGHFLLDLGCELLLDGFHLFK